MTLLLLFAGTGESDATPAPTIQPGVRRYKATRRLTVEADPLHTLHADPSGSQNAHARRTHKANARKTEDG